jgi:hypothetical protein
MVMNGSHSLSALQELLVFILCDPFWEECTLFEFLLSLYLLSLGHFEFYFFMELIESLARVKLVLLIIIWASFWRCGPALSIYLRTEGAVL